jgi:rhodanese-related sulfurtransferase
MKPNNQIRFLVLKFVVLIIFVLLTGSGSSCSSTVQNAGGLPDNDPQLAVRLVEEEGALLLDVRTPGEFISRRLPGSRNLPIEQLPQRLNEIEQLLQGDKNKPIVVYCTAGPRAARAKQILLKAGYNRVTNLGSIGRWPAGR